MAEKQTILGLGIKPVPMKLFATWEVDRTPSNCIPRVSRLRYGSDEGAGVGSFVYTEFHFENNKQDGRSVLAGRSSVARWAGPVPPVLMFTSNHVHWGTRRNETISALGVGVHLLPSSAHCMLKYYLIIVPL
ncbi:hypothetical protein E2C01_000362 [Portunus trituberculatus]|uniref:Uncharacterized protein n=1 Tax=Portunus trituberculatus TaxID=210409 RepID=A0A5B7CER3_PORTR|nr:hypothetical protein [Portunus trituberculatus]